MLVEMFTGGRRIFVWGGGGGQAPRSPEVPESEIEKWADLAHYFFQKGPIYQKRKNQSLKKCQS